VQDVSRSRIVLRGSSQASTTDIGKPTQQMRTVGHAVATPKRSWSIIFRKPAIKTIPPMMTPPAGGPRDGRKPGRCCHPE
jgi:hypothetical protein